jgi:ABC-type transport system involved in multi-copper enzyme maturation permease subunit
MTVLPVVERELRVASARWQTYWGRALVGFGAVMVVIMALASQDALGSRFGNGVSLAQAGRAIFNWLAYLAGAFSLLAGVFYTSDAISSERREGTLGLLFLTDLRGIDVALGKLATSSLGAFYGLIAIQPVLAMTLLLGGVSLGECARLGLTLLITMAASLSIGLLASTFVQSSRAAMVAALFFCLGFTALFPALAWSLDFYPRPGLAAFSPAAAFLISVDGDAPYMANRILFWTSIAYTAACAILALMAAARRLPMAWKDRTRRPKYRNLEFVRHDKAVSKKIKEELLERNPVAWVMVRHTARRLFPWLILLASCLLFSAFPFFDTSYSGFAQGLFAIAGLAHYAIKLWIASECCRQVLDDRRSGALELILCTPISTETFIRGHLISAWRMARIPLTAVLILDFWLMSAAGGMSRDGRADQSIWLVREIVFFADAIALATVSLRAGISAHDGRAALVVAARVILIPWLIIILIGAPFAIMWPGGMMRGGNPVDGSFRLYCWLAICLASSAFWTMRSWRQMKTELRSRGVEPVGQRVIPSALVR